MGGLCAGRVAVVTGAGRGIGREHALLLAAEGAKVVVNDLGAAADGSGRDASPAEEVVSAIRAAGGEAIVNSDDVSDWSGAKRLIDQAVGQFGRLDVLINNAGILRDRMLVTMSEAEWDAVIRVHLKGTFAPAHHAAAHWRDQSKALGGPVDARLINTSSSSGLFGNIGQANYGAAKAGIAAFTVIAARELRRYGVTVNAIMPHALTRMTEGLSLSEEQRARRDPRWVAPIAVWLASTQSREVTGRVFEAGGGILAVMEGWHRGPSVDQIADPASLGPIVLDLVARARRNAGMDGKDAD